MKRTARTLTFLVVLVALLGAVGVAAFAAPIPMGPDGFTPPAIKIAVVHSQTTLDWLNARGTPGRYTHGSKEKATLAYLQARGYDVTEIQGDRDLTDAILKHYDVVVLPSMYGMKFPASEALARYVAAGGGVVATIGSPRVDPDYMPKRGVQDHLNEWWWRVFKETSGNHLWEWGPLSSLYHEQFVNDGAYTPEYTLKPNAKSPIIQEAQAILTARGHNAAIGGITLHHPGANLEMSLKVPGATDCTSAADFNILTKSVKKLYPKTYTAILGSVYGAGRCVKFDYGATDYLQNWMTSLYNPNCPNGYPQGEVAGALFEAAIVWAGTPDGTVAKSFEGTTYADVSSSGASMKVKQVATNSGSALTRATVRFTLYSASGKTLKSWAAKNVTFAPHQSRSFAWTYGSLPSGACKVVASFTHGYPAPSVVSTSSATVSRGSKVRTH